PFTYTSTSTTRARLAWWSLNLNLRRSTHFFAGLIGVGWLGAPTAGTTGPAIPAFAAVRHGPPSWTAVYAAAGAGFWSPGGSNGSPPNTANPQPFAGLAATVVKSSRFRPLVQSVPMSQTAPLWKMLGVTV